MLRTVEHHLWLDHYPDSPQARELAFNSPAESAAIDIVRLAIASSYTPAEESLLVRSERAARRRPRAEARAWDSELTPRQRDLWDIRRFLERIEYRRQDAAGPS